jgi:hypothetical protein
MKKIKYSIIAFLFTLYGCSEKQELKPVDLQSESAIPVVSIQPNQFNIMVLNDTVLADGIQYSEIKLKLDTSLLYKFTSVEISTSSVGHFTDGLSDKTTLFNANGESSFYINSTSYGLCNISAKVVNSISKQASVYFKQSFPDQISVGLSSGVANSSFTTTIGVTTKLLKNSGTFSNGLTVHYSDSTTLNTSIGTFINQTITDSNGESVATYALQDTSYHGFVYLKAYVQTPNGKIRNMNKILIQ